jgi:hypothetical protein
MKIFVKLEAKKFFPSLIHRDKTRVQMPAKMFPHLKLLCWLFMGPTLGFETKQRNSFLTKVGVFFRRVVFKDSIGLAIRFSYILYFLLGSA